MILVGRRIAVVEDDEIMGDSLVQRLELEGASARWWRTAGEARAALGSGRVEYDAVICDIRLPDGNGEDIFERASASGAAPPFLFITAQGDIDQAVRLLRSGGGDYLTKPFEMSVLLPRLAAIAREPLAVAGGSLGISEPMRAIADLLLRVADSDLAVLLTGETGVGKEVAARSLHERSSRRDAPFMAVNCAAIPQDLLESEIFGHEKGAFSGAHARHAGYAERAGSGTLLLDEIGDMPLAMQAKLLRLLEQGSFLRVGGERPVPFKARIVSATHQDLEAAVADGRFRRDLLFRLNAVPVTIPPLRARPDDAVWLLRRFYSLATQTRPGRLRGISPLAEEAVASHPLPGNARELRNRVERAVVLARGSVLTAADLFPETAATQGDDPAFPALQDVREAAERRQIQRALEESSGRIGEAARLLRVSRTTLWEKMQRLGLD